MSRVFTIVVILLLMAVVAVVSHCDMKSVEPPAEFTSEDYGYKESTLVRYRSLLEGADWEPADPPRNPQGMLEAVHGKTGLAFVLIPAGSFMMGSPEEEEGRWEDEGPVHRVKVPAFLICRTECTEMAWGRSGGKFRSHPGRRGANFPAYWINWPRATAWCGRTGLRLPSEAEWEYTCRAGTTTPWFFGDDRSLLKWYAWYDGSRGQRKNPVEQKLPNPWGLYDMYGNVYEWCEDVNNFGYEGAPTDGSAWRSGDFGWERVMRGGCVLDLAKWCRSASRSSEDGSNIHTYPGFRPAADLPALEKPDGD